MNLFLSTGPLPDTAAGQFSLEGQEAHHASKVLRIAEGDTVYATDGKGKICSGRVVRSGPDLVTADIKDLQLQQRPVPHLSIAVGNLKKRDRLEFAAEKAVELGVQEFMVFNADHSEKTSLREDRLKSVVLSAMKQSLRAWLPSVYLYEDLQSMLEPVLEREQKVRLLFAEATSEMDVGTVVESGERDPVHCVVGPEGGFSGQEREYMRLNGAKPISLGPYRLRAETAVIAAASQFASRF